MFYQNSKQNLQESFALFYSIFIHFNISETDTKITVT